MKISYVALAALAFAAGTQAQAVNGSLIEAACQSTCAPLIKVMNSDDCVDIFNGNDNTEEEAQESLDCFCASSASDTLLECSGCLSNTTQGQGLVDVWNTACTSIYANKTAITYVKGTAVASSSAADATATSQDSAAGKQIVAGGLGLLLAGGMALLV